MSLVRKLSITLVVIALLIGTMGAAPMPAQAQAQAAACTLYHYVRWGETLYSIGVHYGVSWVTIANLNGITRPGQIFAGQRLCVSTTRYGTGGPYYPPGYTYPGYYYPGYYTTFSIVSVVPGTSVTIRTYGFPVGDTFDVLMGRYGTLGVGGVKVGSVKASAASEMFTFNIPAGYADNGRVAIRLQSPTSGYFAYNWFYNTTGGTGTGTGGSGTLPGGYYWYYPTFRIASVATNTSVTIVTSNLPPNDKFDVLMSYIGTRGVGGYYVTSFNSGAGGTQTLTFSIPAVLAGQRQIAIRFQSPTSGYFAYNWFYNSKYP